MRHCLRQLGLMNSATSIRIQLSSVTHVYKRGHSGPEPCSLRAGFESTKFSSRKSSFSRHTSYIMSSVSPYLLHVNSKPTKVSDALWSQWYTGEHLPDLVSSKTSTRATFYKELPPLLGGEPHSPRNFLALYQTDFAECLKTENYTNLRKTSELFPKEGGTVNIQDNGDFNARNYELVQEYDPNGVGNGR